MDAPKLCSQEDASVRGGIGPFGLLVLASENLEEHTAIFFRVYRDQNTAKVLMCSDQRRQVIFYHAKDSFAASNFVSDGYKVTSFTSSS